MAARKRPKHCIETKPNSRSIQFAGEYINLSEISRQTSIHFAYLSHIFRGTRNPSLRTTVAISGALGMTLDSFVEALTLHVSERAA